jgi:hypothetical protein
MKLFIKKLGNNESGYREGRPSEAGKFIFIYKNWYSMFPFLSPHIKDDNKIIRFRLLSGEEIGLNLVYHNSKICMSQDNGRDEIRLYRNSALNTALNIDTGVIIIVVQLDTNLYGIEAVQVNDADYSDIERLATPALQNSDDLRTVQRIKDLEGIADNSSNNMTNEQEVTRNAVRIYTAARVQQPAAKGDPGSIFSSLINSQDKFSECIRNAYDNKCALRGISLVENRHIGCDAAHIQPDSHNGPLLPTNGFLLSADLHRCFDSGLMSLTDGGVVVVSGNVPGNSELHSYKGKIITPTAGWAAFKPYKEYCKYHREHIFESRL